MIVGIMSKEEKKKGSKYYTLCVVDTVYLMHFFLLTFLKISLQNKNHIFYNIKHFWDRHLSALTGSW